MFTQEKKQSLSLSPCLLKKVVQPVGTDWKPHEKKTRSATEIATVQSCLYQVVSAANVNGLCKTPSLVFL